jgi:WD40 repeat protein
LYDSGAFSIKKIISLCQNLSMMLRDLSNFNRREPLKSLGSISSHTRPVECLDGRAISDILAVLYTGDTMGIIKVWDLNKGSSRWTAALTHTYEHHRTRINELLYGNGQLWTGKSSLL